MPRGYKFVDILALDPDLLAMACRRRSARVAVVILLFPCSSAMYEARRLEERALQNGSDSGIRPHDSAFFLVQHADFGNACGTIAAIHAISNADFGGRNDSGTPLRSFCDENVDATPSERGRALLNAKALKICSDGQAQSHSAQTSCPSRHGPDLDHHFVAFSSIDGRLVELDGTKSCAINHGAVPKGDGRAFLNAAADVIRRNFMDVDPDSIEFALMALCERSNGS